MSQKLVDCLEIGIETSVATLPIEAQAQLPPMEGFRIVSVLRADEGYMPLLYRADLVESEDGKTA